VWALAGVGQVTVKGAIGVDAAFGAAGATEGDRAGERRGDLAPDGECELVLEGFGASDAPAGEPGEEAVAAEGEEGVLTELATELELAGEGGPAEGEPARCGAGDDCFAERQLTREGTGACEGDSWLDCLERFFEGAPVADSVLGRRDGGLPGEQHESERGEISDVVIAHG